MDNVSSHGVVSSDPQNQADPKGVHTRSFFSEKDLTDEFFASLPFGEIRPFTFFESVPDDKRIRSQFINQVQSYTLKAPLMQAVHMKKLVCQVPREAILPFNWEKWFKNPVIGQDINQVAPDAGTAVLGFWRLLYNLMSAVKNALPNSTTINSTETANAFVNSWFLYLLLAESFYSDGNLLKYCRISGRPWAFSHSSDGHTLNSVDYVFDKFCSLFLETIDHAGVTTFTLTFGSGSSATVYNVDPTIDPNRSYPGLYISFREALSLMRDDFNFTIDLGAMQSQPLGEFDDLRLAVTQDIECDIQFVDDPATTDADLTPIDLKRLWAYQLCCAHFLTNDSVDFVYTAELFRQYIFSLVNRDATTGYAYVNYFVVNGYEYEYDYLSAMYFKRVVNAVAYYFTNGSWPSGSTSPKNLQNCLAYLAALFGFNRSLRYLDYFTGSKTRPLAVGDVNVQVNSGLVNVVDTQAKTFLARFLNVINRVGMRNYVEGVFNVRQAPDWHNPQYLVKVDDLVTGQRVENTGAQQWDPDFPNSVTCTLHGNSDRFAFESDFDRSSVIIGLVWFDIDRVYSMATERQNFHYNRFDEFQPFMQYTGDQALYRGELGSPLISGPASLLPMSPFGYKLRNAEYKERYPQCAGAFCNDMLDGYLFKADILESSGIQNIGPSFIRSFPSELDRFYLSSTGFSLATYFHFIVRFASLYSGSRPMAYAPTLM